MGFRIRKQIKIAPGIKLNLGKKGLGSVSVGGKGATLNVGSKNGPSMTSGIPGTGISHTQRLRGKTEGLKQKSPRKREGSNAGILFLILIVLLYFFLKH